MCLWFLISYATIEGMVEAAPVDKTKMDGKRTKTEADLIATVANIADAEACLRFASGARTEGMTALAAACEERAIRLKPLSSHKNRPSVLTPKQKMTTHVVAEQALPMLIKDYEAGLPPTTYGELAQRCGIENQTVRWFGQVTDLIDAACALADVPSFALVRVREANGEINHAAWRKQDSHLRDLIIARGKAGKWTPDDFMKINDSLATFSAHALGNKKAWDFVRERISIEDWARGVKPP